MEKFITKTRRNTKDLKFERARMSTDELIPTTERETEKRKQEILKECEEQIERDKAEEAKQKRIAMQQEAIKKAIKKAIFGRKIRREIIPKRIPRNEPCPCGSKVKYKHCCGKPANKIPPIADTEQKMEAAVPPAGELLLTGNC
jgi:uncharacterized protein YecA (UPF0149 family)